MADTPQLGYGQRAEAPIDAVNIWMRGQPWYQALIRSFGQDPNDVHLNDTQKQQVIRAAQANGIIVDEGHDGQEVDDSGNFQAKSHALRNTLIVAGIAAAALATAGAAGAFAPAAAGTVAGVEGGAYGVSAGTVAALGSGAMAAVPVTAATTAAISTAAASVGLPAAKAAAAKVAASGGALTAENILRYAVPVAGGIIGSVIQAKAAGDASDAEQAYLKEALAYAKEKDAGNIAREGGRYSDFTGNIAPYVQGGNAAGSRMQSLLGISAPLPSTQTTSRYAPMPTAPQTAMPQPTPVQQPQAAPAPQQPMVMVQAPDGSTKQVSQRDADYYVTKGAKILQGAA